MARETLAIAIRSPFGTHISNSNRLHFNKLQAYLTFIHLLFSSLFNWF